MFTIAFFNQSKQLIYKKKQILKELFKMMTVIGWNGRGHYYKYHI